MRASLAGQQRQQREDPRVGPGTERQQRQRVRAQPSALATWLKRRSAAKASSSTAPPTVSNATSKPRPWTPPLPDAAWLRRVLTNAVVTCCSNNREVQARLCAGGAGLAVLPRPLGDATPGIAALALDEPPPGRDTFVGYHRDLRRLTRMRALLGLVIENLAN